MELVISYLQATAKANPPGFQWTAAMPRVLRLVNEFKDLIRYAKYYVFPDIITDH
jgi:hypothetical protein